MFKSSASNKQNENKFASESAIDCEQYHNYLVVNFEPWTVDQLARKYA